MNTLADGLHQTIRSVKNFEGTGWRNKTIKHSLKKRQSHFKI
uniref:Uncharacterized protein n=1 Tax=Arundo donax TaxID=35708 RepID=A0A0A8Y2F8_ARUDO